MNSDRPDMPLRSALYVGHVMHRRMGAISHRFVYRVFSLLLDLDELPTLRRRIRIFSYNRFNLLSFHDRDHGPRDGTPLKPWACARLRDAGIRGTPHRIRLLCFPRILGYAFNPLSLWFCEDEAGAPIAVIHEVSNTFGGRHCYVLPVDSTDRGDPIAQTCIKRFYVSPFLPLAGRYAMRLKAPSERLSLAILYSAGDGTRLAATQTGRRRNLTTGTLLAAMAAHPLMTVKVIAGIHWEAVRLWLKGARLHPRTAGAAATGSGGDRSAARAVR